MRNDFTVENSCEKKVTLTIRVPKDFDDSLEHKLDEAFANAVYDLGCELVDASEYHDTVFPSLDFIHIDKLSFRDFDNTEIPLQLFFGYDVPKEHIQVLAASWGYKGELCEDITFCLDVFDDKSCSIEAVLTFIDKEQRWVDVSGQPGQALQLIYMLSIAETERSSLALEEVRDIFGDEMLQRIQNAFSLTEERPKETLSSQIELASSKANWENTLNSYNRTELPDEPHR